MVQRIQPGQYEVGTDSYDPERKGYESETQFGVIRGDTANEASSGGFHKQYGFKSSKWYAYKWTTTTVRPQLQFSPTAPPKAFNQTYSETRIAQTEFDSKKSAVEYVKDQWGRNFE